LIALSRREAHIAGSHLLDPETSEYNIKCIRKFLPDTPVRMIGLVLRKQDLIVASGNPKHIQSLGDLARKGVYSVNRQCGAGTRILLDQHLKLLGIHSEHVEGNENEEFAHLNVAAVVASERSDCGLGIRAAASVLGLDFVPLFEERYDLVIPSEHVEHSMIKSLLALLHNPEFCASVQAQQDYRI